MPRYDLQAMGEAAGELESLRDEFDQCRGGLAGDMLPGTPFGALDAGERACAAIRGFHDKVRDEFGTGAAHLAESARWLRSLAIEVEQTDLDNARHITLADDEPGR
ncbi:hypothetical protein [Amycolatopsis sp. NPDC059657]|uniref:hypothetical protein n=1 Tax=Amycolatopsis sp. NPDC059657 TaxID=3346899 RepID=UPI00366EF342